MKTEIRLAAKTVVPIAVSEDINGFRTLKFGGVGTDKEVFELPEKYILNYETINMRNDFVKVVVPERVCFGLFSGVTFTREVELPQEIA